MFKDRQILTIHELYEQTPAGQSSRVVTVICDNDLVDSCKPGDRVQVVSAYRAFLPKESSIFFQHNVDCQLYNLQK